MNFFVVVVLFVLVFFPVGDENFQCDSVFPPKGGIIKVTYEIPFVGHVLKQ